MNTAKTPPARTAFIQASRSYIIFHQTDMHKELQCVSLMSPCIFLLQLVSPLCFSFIWPIALWRGSNLGNERQMRRGAIESLQTEEQTETEKPEAKSSPEPDPFNELRNLYNSPSESEMMTPGPSSDQPTNPAPKVEPKVEQSDNNAQWAATIATSVIETINNKKEDNGKPLLPEPYEGNQKDTGRTREWKVGEQMKLFPEDPDHPVTKKAAEEMWDSFKARFRKTWQPVDVKGDAWMKIEDLRMKERADDYVNQF
ncbi:hypothetical protein Moror_4320 [Moniliophthora roreri MCA 2997]|uniref:Retrotransposon gag domain-containing protein n=1 Tax=Moniliophthora roreri (strain MCA 2997) TaxID=1381753 RepID=V2WJU7_MONRO|nr:hypothetical protein Moror_4320 [Moniliophthora roreri MCA 2997]